MPPQITEESPRDNISAPQVTEESPPDNTSAPQVRGRDPLDGADDSQGRELSDSKLLEIAAPARDKKRISPHQMSEIILKLCSERFLSPRQISQLVQRNQKYVQQFISQLVTEGSLCLRYPKDPSHPEQAYKTVENPGE